MLSFSKVGDVAPIPTVMNIRINNFALIGAAGYIAPRHMKAIRDTGNVLTTALDHHDSVGILDSFFPGADFFTEFERFDRHIDKLRREQAGKAIDYVSICSPNYLHDSHIRFALRSNANAICEKPLVLNHWNLDALQKIENETGKQVYTVLQLRLHPSVQALKKQLEQTPPNTKLDVTLTYVTARGKWYLNSWKGDEKKSGAVTTNIGIHFFDMLHFVFGNLTDSKLHYRDAYKGAGFLEFEKARVKWFVSIDEEDLPAAVRQQNERTYRLLEINGNPIELSEGFADLHTRVYEEILAGNGFSLEENRGAIETAGNIRTQTPLGLVGEYHPLLKPQS